jgi:hypothetical protein
MRSTVARFAIVVAMMLLVAGCRSGGTPWGWGRKSAGTSEPQLPSASAPPSNYGSQYSSATAPQTPSAFADPAGAPPYQAAPYPGQPASYDNPSGAPAANYGGAAQTPAVDYGANSAAPQQGPYAESYGQPPAGTAPVDAGYPTTATPIGYQPPPPGAAPQSAAPPAGADPYANPGGYGAAPSGDYSSTPPAGGNPYDNGQYPPNNAGGQPTADIRYGSDPGAAVAAPEQASADRYGSSDPAPDPGSTAEGYRPGSTGYNPGQTGYSPPGVPQYQVPAQPNVVATARKDPYYRPGGTSDYATTPGGQTPTASAAADRYNTPPVGYDQANPYASPGGYQSPATGGGAYY